MKLMHKKYMYGFQFHPERNKGRMSLLHLINKWNDNNRKFKKNVSFEESKLLFTELMEGKHEESS